MRLQTRAWIKIVIAYALLAAAIVAGSQYGFQKRLHPDEDLGIIALFCYILTQVFGVWGSFDLARARGYPEEVIVGMVVIGFLCAPILILILPLAVFFGLEDKNRKRKKNLWPGDSA